MTRNRQQSRLDNFKNSRLYCAITSVFAGFGIIIACLMIFSLLITRIDVSDNVVTVLSCISLCVGAYCSGLICSKRKRKNGLLLGIFCGAVMFLLLMIFGAIFAKAAISLHFTSKLLMTLICGGLGGIIGVNSRRKKY